MFEFDAAPKEIRLLAFQEWMSFVYAVFYFVDLYGFGKKS